VPANSAVYVVGLKSETVFHIPDAFPHPVPGPMSEKDIKGIVLERCKDLGIKSSNRGLIAGTLCAGCTLADVYVVQRPLIIILTDLVL
jgi:hypothetical protein